MSHDDREVTRNAAARDAAAEWFVRLRDEALSDGEIEAFRRWRAASPENAWAFEEIERLWATLDQVAARPERPLDSRRASLRRRVAPHRRGWTGDGSQRRSVSRRFLLAASLTAAIAVGVVASPLLGPSADYSTAIGQQRFVELTDGSRLQLNSRSSVSVDLSETSRRITLHSGEVYAEVATDSDRPFVVDAGLGTATALGTSFAVERGEESFEVIVTSNRVEISAPEAPPFVAAAGQGFGITAQGARPLAPSDVATSLAWRSGRLLFEAVPLGEVLRELDRYRSGRIVVLDRSVLEIPVTAAFSIARIDRALDTIEQTLPVRLVRLGNHLTLVLPASASGTASH